MSQFEYYVDLVLCIDGTGSMSDVIDGVKAFASGMHAQLNDALANAKKHVNGIRVKVIVFRDFAADGADAFQVLDFKKIPEEEAEVLSFVNKINATGGGDDPENGLEALATAIQSDWTHEGTKQRHLIMLFTDVPPHEYGKVTGPAQPAGLPATIEDVYHMWKCEQGATTRLKPSARRLFLFAPDNEHWDKWRDIEFVTGLPIEELLHDPDATRQQIIDLVVSSVGGV